MFNVIIFPVVFPLTLLVNQLNRDTRKVVGFPEIYKYYRCWEFKLEDNEPYRLFIIVCSVGLKQQYDLQKSRARFQILCLAIAN